MKNGSLTSLSIPKLPLTDDGKKAAHGDGRGLWVVCEPRADGSINRSYYFRYTFGSERPWLHMGHIDELTLSAARIKAGEFRMMVRDGKDPRRQAAQTASGQQTFLAYFTENKADFVGRGEAYPWEFAVRNFSKLHNRPIGEITSKDVYNAIKAYWITNAVSASRSLMKVKKIFNKARVNGLCSANPALLEDMYAQGVEKPRDASPIVPHAALPHADLPTFMKGLVLEQGISARCAEFAILTGSRSQEARLAEWSWLNADMTTITMPAEVMKAGLKHTIPLAKQVTDMLRKLPRTSKYIFPSPRTFEKDDEIICPQTLVDLVNRVWGRGKLHLHGFRSTFHDYCTVNALAQDMVIEMCIAHVVGTQARRAYARDELIDLRRPVMQAFADYATGKAPKGNVVRLRAA